MCCQACNKNQTRCNSLEWPSHCSAFADSIAPSAQLLHAPYGSLGSNSYLCALKHFLCIYPRWESSQNGAGQTNAVDKMGKVQSIKHHTVWKTLSESPQTHFLAQFVSVQIKDFMLSLLRILTLTCFLPSLPLSEPFEAFLYVCQLK